MSHGPACKYCSDRPGWLVPLYVRMKGLLTGKRKHRIVGYICETCARGGVRQHRGDKDAPVYSSPKRADIAP